MAIERAKEDADSFLQGFVATVKPDTPRPATPKEVQAFLDGVPESVEVGDFVKWRPGFSDHNQPEEGAECIVTQVFDEPFLDKQEGSAMHTYHFTVAMIVKSNQGEELLIELPVDGRRMEYARREDGTIKQLDDDEFSNQTSPD